MANVFLPVTTATAIGNPVESDWGTAMRLAVEAAAPAASVSMYVGDVAPDGHLLMQGQTVTSFQSLYPVAWTRVPAAWKSGSSVTFPDTRSRVPVGASADFALGTVGGANSAVLAIEQMPAHNHGGATGGQSNDHAHYVSMDQNTHGQSADHSHTGYTGYAGTHGHGWGAGVNFWYDSGPGGYGWTLASPGTYTQTSVRAAWNHDGNHSHGVQTYGVSNDHAHRFVFASWTSGYNTDHTHVINNAGGTTPVSRMQAYFVVTYMMRVF